MTDVNFEAADHFEDLNPNLYRGARYFARQGKVVLDLAVAHQPPATNPEPEIPENIVLSDN